METPAFVAPERAVDVRVNRVDLRVWEWGDPTAPVILCVHGAHDHGRMWDELAPQIAALGFHVRAIDVRGHGRSGALRSGHMWGEAVLDIACLAQRADAPVGLLGHSMGGGQVLTAAVSFPELVSWAVSIDGLGPPTDAFDDLPVAEQCRQALSYGDKVRSRGPRVWGSRSEMAERRGQTNHRLPAAWLDHLVLHGSRPVDGGFVFATDPLFQVGIPDGFTVDHAVADFHRVTCPVLVIMGGEHDTWSDLSDEEIEARAASFPDARLHIVDGAGHYVHIEQPDATMRLIADFVGEVRS